MLLTTFSSQTCWRRLWLPIMVSYLAQGKAWVLNTNVRGGKGEWPHEPRTWNDAGISVCWVCTQLGLRSSFGKDRSTMAVLSQASGGPCSKTLDFLTLLCWERNTGKWVLNNWNQAKGQKYPIKSLPLKRVTEESFAVVKVQWKTRPV